MSSFWQDGTMSYKKYTQIRNKDARPALLLAGDILEDCRAFVFLRQWETVIDCFGPTLANIRTIMAMIDDYNSK